MAGSWETIQNARVLVGILHVDTTTIAWALGLRQLQIPGSILPVSGMPYDMSRNEVIKAALANNTTHVFFLDSDVIPPPDTIHRLLAHRQPIVSGIYYRRSPPQGVPVMMKGGRWVTEYPKAGLMEVDVVGAGCLLLSREFLEDMRDRFPQEPWRPWFNWKVDRKQHLPQGDAMSEDFTLCKWAIEKGGYKVLVDCSVRCLHVGFAEASHDSFVPLRT